MREIIKHIRKSRLSPIEWFVVDQLDGVHLIMDNQLAKPRKNITRYGKDDFILFEIVEFLSQHPYIILNITLIDKLTTNINTDVRTFDMDLLMTFKKYINMLLEYDIDSISYGTL